MSNERIVFVMDALEEDVKERLKNGETPVATSLEVEYTITPHDNYTHGAIIFYFEGELESKEDWHAAVLDSDSEIDYIKLAGCRVDDLDINWKELEVYI